MDGSYPPGVTGDMIDEYFGEGKYAKDEDYCCGNCIHYSGIYCTKNWNNLDEAYKTDEDEKEPEDYCDDYEEDT